MRRSMAAALILTVLLFGGAYLTTGGSAAQEPESGDDTAQEPSGQGRRDSTVLLTVQDGDAAEEMALDAYLRGVVRGEMPASFETEALRAQAAAERTYVYHQLAAGRKEAHPDADVCTDPGFLRRRRRRSGAMTLRRGRNASRTRWPPRTGR